MNEFYVLEEDQARANEIYQTIVSMRKQTIDNNVEALQNTLVGNYTETALCDMKNHETYQEMLSLYHELDKLQAKRIHRERLERTIEKLAKEGKISVVKISRIRRAEGL